VPATPFKEKFFVYLVQLLNTIQETNGYWSSVKYVDRQREILRQLPKAQLPAFFINESEEEFQVYPSRKRESSILYAVVGMVHTTDRSEGASDIHTKLNRLEADFINAFDSDFQFDTISGGDIHLVDHRILRIGTDEGVFYPRGIFIAECRAVIRYRAGGRVEHMNRSK
jgi:hypothetical protein